MSKHRTAVIFVNFSYSANQSFRIDTGQEQVALKQAQELFCLKELVVSFNPESDLETAKKPFFLKSHLKRSLFDILKKQAATTVNY